jgi:hypothetical protein
MFLYGKLDNKKINGTKYGKYTKKPMRERWTLRIKN